MTPDCAHDRLDDGVGVAGRGVAISFDASTAHATMRAIAIFVPPMSTPTISRLPGVASAGSDT